MFVLRRTKKLTQTKMEIAFRQNLRILKVMLSVGALKLYEGVVIQLHSFLPCAMRGMSVHLYVWAI